MSNEEIAAEIAAFNAKRAARKPRKGSRAARLNRLTEIRETAANSPVIAQMIDTHDSQPIVITTWS